MYAIVIPAYNPDQRLLEIVRNLAAEGRPIVVVDDGSDSPESAGILEQIRGCGAVTLLRHPWNRGKGCALKTGLAFVLKHKPDLVGVATIDADGQHAVADLLKVGARLERGEGKLILGVRSAWRDVPLRSHIGNAVTRRVFAAISGVALRDTQCGLRGIPRALLPALACLPGARFEYEMAMLFFCAEQGIPIAEELIETRYFDDNRSSHFKPWRDSARIYRMLLGTWLRLLRRKAPRPGSR